VSNTFDRIRSLISEGSVRTSEHGYDELAADGLRARELIESVSAEEVIEDYPDYPKGPCVPLAPTNDKWAFGPYRVGGSRWSYESGGTCYRVLTRPRKMGTWVQAEAPMSKSKRTKLVHEGNYVAEVDIELLEEPEGWSPYLSLEDAYRPDDVREALRRGDVKTAAKYARVFSLTPVAV